MGLDITAYKNLVPAPDAPVDSDGYPEDYDSYAVIHEGVIEWCNKAFPGRCADLTPGIYSFSDSFRFRAGSYGGYSQWRDTLAAFAGYGTAEAVWRNPAFSGDPFYELINFSDCEGYIGTETSKKLAKDFADFEPKLAEMAEHPYKAYFIERYTEWKLAFEIASKNGCVSFG